MAEVGLDDGDPDGATELLLGATRVKARTSATHPSVEPGTPLGRYIAIEESGRGGMGAVIRAYDPKLQREVALKRLHVSTMTDDARARLVREARAMAQLSHPNVVAVHDVETGEGFGVMVVMEYVQGTTLREWLRAEPRSWREILDVFVDAGRGLVAAHGAGLLHRDFKPANVLIGADRRVRVTDFGLARPPKHVDRAEENSEPDDGDSRALAYESLDSLDASLVRRIPDGLTEELTSASVVMGTPTYMAPEQHAGLPLTVAADQFAFCVSLWEALAGSPPYVGRLAEISAAKRHGPPSWPRDARAPRRVQAALRRGLAADPQERWPTIDALSRELQTAALGPERRRRLAVVVGASTIVIAGAWILWSSAERRCAGAGEQLVDVWDAPRGERVRAALVETALPYAESTATRVGAHVDDYAREWIEMHTDACEATTVRGEQSTASLDLRMACLHRAKIDLAAAADVLEHADAQVLERADRLVDALPPLSRCADVDALQRAVAPPLPEQADDVERERGALAQSRALLAAGKNAEAARILEEASTRIDAVDYAPLYTELALERGRVRSAEAAYDESVASLQLVMQEAPRLGQWNEASAAAIHLATLVGDRLGRPEAGLAWIDVARGLGEVAADPTEARLDTRSAFAGILVQQGKYAEAEIEYGAVLRTRIDALGEDHPEVARARVALASALHDGGKFVESERELRLALSAQERELGTDHPIVAATRNNLAASLTSQGKYTEAESELQRALTTRVRVLGAQHLSISDTRINLAEVLYSQGEYASAVDQLDLALATRIAVLGENHPDVAAARNNLAPPLVAMGDLAGAEENLRAALAGWEAAFGPEHPDVAMARGNLAVLLGEVGKYAEAEAMLRAALPSWERALGPDHPDVARGRVSLGSSLGSQGRFDEAEIEIRTGLAAQLRSLPPEHPEIGSTRQALSFVLGRAGKTEDAEREARAGLTIFEAAFGPDHPDVARSRHVVGRLLVDIGREDEAIPLLEQAARVLLRDDVPVDARASTAFDLARALGKRRSSRARARELARSAAEMFDGERWADDRAEVEDWLRAHP